MRNALSIEKMKAPSSTAAACDLAGGGVTKGAATA